MNSTNRGNKGFRCPRKPRAHRRRGVVNRNRPVDEKAGRRGHG